MEKYYGTVRINEYGNGVRLIYDNVERDDQENMFKTIVGRFEKGVIIIDNESGGTITIPYNDGKILIRGNEYSRVLSFNDIKPKTIEEFARKIVDVINIDVYALKVFQPSTATYKDVFKRCTNLSPSQIDETFSDVDQKLEKMYTELKRRRIGTGGIEFRSFQTKKVQSDDTFKPNCLEDLRIIFFRKDKAFETSIDIWYTEVDNNFFC